MKFLKLISAITLISTLVSCGRNYSIMTVNGTLGSEEMGISLTHEHVLVDFIGADSINYNRWSKDSVLKAILPFMVEAKRFGCRTFIDCTPEFIGRDPLLLKSISDSTGMNILTNTGYYGAGKNRYLPEQAYSESAEQLAARWTDEFMNGIEGTGIKPGFIKTGVAEGELSDLHRILIKAAAITHLRTGLVIASHTGPAIPAFQQLEVLKEEGVSPEAFIWVHAQAEKDSLQHIRAAKAGAWVSFDGINNENAADYLRRLRYMKGNLLLGKVLLSHDSGWYTPGKEGGGNIRGFTALFTELLPLLRNNGFTEKEIDQLLVENPAEAFSIRVRKL